MAKAASDPRWSLEPYCIGMKLRNLRTQKRLTLLRLSVETGLSTALLSKLETDRMIPTLTTLANICRVYGVGLSYFFSEPAKHTVSITRKEHLTGNSRSQEALKHTVLNAAPGNSGLAVEMIEFPAGSSARASENGRIATYFVYVLEGRLRLDTGDMHEVLESGDCAYVDSEIEMAWGAAGKERSRALVVKPGYSREV
jgi:transcriptional regulator with XRE-family HTH domain